MGWSGFKDYGGARPSGAMALMAVSVMALAGAAQFACAHGALAYETKAVISGIAGVKDGDGILFGDVEIRLQGIAAPEDNSKKTEPGGPEATANLKKLADGKLVVCHLDGTTASSNRPVGICYVDGHDLGALQVRQGFARDCARYSGRRYATDEVAAKAAGSKLAETYPLPSYC